MEYLDELVSRYRGKGLLVDTNILLLYVVGIYDPNRIQKFKRTMAFTVDEFDFLRRFFKFFEKLVTTPNILTEVSNLSGQLPDILKRDLFGQLARLIPSFQETYSSSSMVSSLTHFGRLGLTDSGIVDLAKDRYLVLTDDFRLAGHLQKEGIDVINFNYLRPRIWNSSKSNR